MVTRLLIVLALLWSPGLAAGATFVVNSTFDAVDAVPGNGVCATAGSVCTLRAAIQEANALSGAHVITLPAGTYTLTIPGRGEFSAATGDLNVSRDITINGDSTATTIIDANGLDRVFQSFSGGLTLNDLTVQNGNPGDNVGGGIYISGVNLTLTRVVVKSCNSGTSSGGGIVVFGSSTVTLTDTTISSNSSWNGGGIYYAGASPSTLTLTDTTISGNTATSASGGGVYLSYGTTATMTRTTISNNSASARNGGGISIFGALGPSTLTVNDSTITQNVSSGGGGVFLDSFTTTTINRTTISGNSASQGGGINSSGTATLANTTISGNTATGSGGAFFTGFPEGGAVSAMTLVNVTIDANSTGAFFSGAVAVDTGALEVRNTIIANSTGAGSSNCSFTSATFTDQGNNLEFPGTACGFGLASDRRADPLLRALAANGGSTQTQALGIGSPAIDAGDDASCAAAPVSGVDQRGSSRPAGAHCDIGAYESGATVPFTDDPLVATLSVIRAVHVTELRTRINALRAFFGLPAVTWTDPNLTGLPMKAVHIQEMRSALLAAYSAASRTPPSFTDPTLVQGVTTVRASHIAELRAAVIAIE